MSTKIKLDGRIDGQSADALDRLGERLWAHPATRLMTISEYEVTELVDPGPGRTKDRVVRVGLLGCEVGLNDQEHILRSAQKALYAQRTAVGTITEDGDVKYCEDVLAVLGDHMDATEAVRLRIALDWLVGELAALGRKAGLDAAGLRKETKTLTVVARKALSGEQLRLDDATKAKAAFIAAEVQIAAEEAEQLAAAKGRLEETAPAGDTAVVEGADGGAE